MKELSRKQKYDKKYYQKNKKKLDKINRESNRRFILRNPWMTSYNNAKQRCENPNNPNYPWWGAKGIKFLLTKEECEKLWFRDKADSLEYPTIDRINNKRNYTFKNCQFIENIVNSLKDRTHPKIGQYTLKGKLINIFNSQGEANRQTGIHQSDISRTISGLFTHAGGFIWRNIK